MTFILVQYTFVLRSIRLFNVQNQEDVAYTTVRIRAGVKLATCPGFPVSLRPSTAKAVDTEIW
jgi:hypothetical protein